MAEKKYFVVPGTSLASKGVILDEGKVVSAKNFASNEVFNKLVKAKLILTSAEYEKKIAALNKSFALGKKKADEDGAGDEEDAGDEDGAGDKKRK